jgi:selenocysteine lyase/cysteine desulfurase
MSTTLAERMTEVHARHRELVRQFEKQIADVDSVAIYHPSNDATVALFAYRAKLVEFLRQLDRVRLPGVSQ